MKSDKQPRVSFEREQANKFSDLVAARVQERSRTLTTIVNSLALAQAELRVPLNHNSQEAHPRDARKALDALAASGMITVEWGSVATGRETTIKPTAQFVQCLTDVTFGGDALTITTRSDPGAVLLRDEDKRPVKIPNGTRLELLRPLTEFNLANARHTWTIEHPAYGHLGQRVPWDDVTLLDRSVLIYDRIFSRSLKQGGRFYCQLQSAVPSKDRGALRANGQPLVELDFKACWVRMAYDRRGLAAPEDCYALPGLPRPLVKLLTTIAMNAKSRKSALLAFAADWADRGEEPVTGTQLGAALDQILRHHAPIADDFFASRGMAYQFLESEVCQRVMTEMARAGVPLLAIHDGFYVPAAFLDQLEAAMVAAYRAVVAKDATPVISRLLPTRGGRTQKGRPPADR